MVYKVNDGVDFYMDNTLKASQHTPNAVTTTSKRNGQILLGQNANNIPGTNARAGKITADFITFWNRPIIDNERNLL